jgi:hypothetical protein
MIEDPSFYLQMKDNLDNKQYEETKSEPYKMVIVVREDIKMGKGKIAAQVGHGGNI